MVEGAELALALYNARKKKDLKFKEVISANYLPFTSSREIYLTFKAEDVNTSSPVVYQARLQTKDYDWREKVIERLLVLGIGFDECLLRPKVVEGLVGTLL